jgi:hypothetical protein
MALDLSFRVLGALSDHVPISAAGAMLQALHQALLPVATTAATAIAYAHAADTA